MNSLQLLSLPLVVAEKVSILTGVNVLVNLQQEPLVELECLKEGLFKRRVEETSGTGEKLNAGTEPAYLRELFGQLPDTFKELSENRRHLFWIPVQLVTPTVSEQTLSGQYQ